MDLQKIGFVVRRSAAMAMMRCMSIRNSIYSKIDKRQRFYAEFFTDAYIRKNFFADYSYKGSVVEVGCATPELLSMSKHFRESGWRCIGIEPNPRFAVLHQNRGYEVYEYAAADFEADNHEFIVAEADEGYSDQHLSAHSYSSLSIKPEYANYKDGAIKHFKQTKIRVNVRRLDNILKKHCSDLKTVDLLSIDVEGYELEVMKGFAPAQFNTRVIVLENLFHSASYTEYMNSVGYSLHKKIQYNYIYVPTAKALAM